MGAMYDWKKNKEIALEAIKNIYNDEYYFQLCNELHGITDSKERLKKIWRDFFGSDNLDEVFYNADTDSYVIKPDDIATST
jgi:hypothetical protein